MGHISFVGKLDGVTLSAGAPAIAPGWTLDLMGKHSLDFWLTSEDLPDPDNRVTLDRDGQDRAGLHAQQRRGPPAPDPEARAPDAAADELPGARRRLPPGTLLPQPLPRPADSAGRAWPTRTAPSASGTTPRTSALDADCRAHEVDNLYVVDGSFFPSSGAVNPALTIMANALRVGDRILERLGRAAERRPARGQTGGSRGMRHRAGRAAGLGAGSSRPRSLGATSLGGAIAPALVRAAARFRGQPSAERDRDERAPARPRRQAVAMVGLTVADMDRSVDVLHPRARLREGVATTRSAGSAYEQLQGVFGVRHAGRAAQAGRRVAPAHRVPGAARAARAGRLAQQRPLVPARRHHRERHGQRLRPAAAVQGAARLDRAAAPAQDHPQRRRHPGVLLPGPRRPSARGPAVPAGQGRPKWHAPSDRLFLGIDHTAIVVSDTEAQPGVLSRRARASGWPARA